MENIKLNNKPKFVNDDILNDLISQIYVNKKIKNIFEINFKYIECIDKNSLVYTLSICCNKSATFYNDIKLFSGNDIIVKTMVFSKKENYKPFLYG